jgi:hypothetical protein
VSDNHPDGGDEPSSANAISGPFKGLTDKVTMPLTAFGLLVSAISGAIVKWNALYELFVKNPVTVVVISFFYCQDRHGSP